MTHTFGRTPIVARWASALMVVAGMLGVAVSPAPAQIVDPDWSPPRTVYIPETGQTVDRLFLDLWRYSGGYWAYGFPITPEYTLANGHVVQYYEYARFEYLPEGDEFGNLVRLGNIGEELRPYVLPRRYGVPIPLAEADPRAGEADASATGVAAELGQTLLAWAPIPTDQIQPNSATYRYVPETRHSVRHGFKAFWEGTGEAAYLGNPLTEEYVQDGTTYQVFERGQLAWNPSVDPYMIPVGEILAERYGLDTSPQPRGDVPVYSEELFVPPIIRPGAPPAGPVQGAAKTILVSIGQQALWAFEGSTVVLSSYVSTGKPRFDTPTGLYYVNSKLPVQDMAGVIGGESYNVPAVPDVMYFTNRGHAIHGTYWHTNFGNVMSHGCVNLPMDVAEWLYEWTPTGTPVLIVA
jgi:hypothetical protein